MPVGFFGERLQQRVLLEPFLNGRGWNANAFVVKRQRLNRVVGPRGNAVPEHQKKEFLDFSQVPDPDYIILPPGSKPGVYSLRTGDGNPPWVNVQFSVVYKAPRRQFLCLAGSEPPLGWSFNVTSRQPGLYAPGDVWVRTVRPW